MGAVLVFLFGFAVGYFTNKLFGARVDAWFRSHFGDKQP